MKLHTVLVTYNRLDLTKEVLKSYLETVSVPFSLSLVDNHSHDGTAEWLLQHVADGVTVHVLAKNRYPGYACNLGWSDAPADATHLQRCDNDHVFLPGWCEEVEDMFKTAKIGQIGLRTNEEELFAKTNVGGNCIIRRELWDQGLRWDERPWPQLRDEVGKGFTEDSFMSPAVRQMGYTWTRVRQPCIVPISPEHTTDPYYIQSWKDRGINL